MPKVSVIIPVFNTEKYLRKCLDSVCIQTLSDIEIICVDDCSTDNSLNILKEYASKDNRIKLIEFKENKGAAVARNTGIIEAKGEYIGFIDSDDYIDQNFYENLYKKVEIRHSDIVKGSDMKLVFEDGRIETDEQNFKIKKNKINFWCQYTTAIYKRDFILKNEIDFPVGLLVGEDPVFTIKAAILADNVEVINNAQYYYVRHEGSLNSDIWDVEKIESYCKYIEIVSNFIINKNLPDEEHRMFFSWLVNNIYKTRECKTKYNRKMRIKLTKLLEDNISKSARFPIKVLFDTTVFSLTEHDEGAKRGIFFVAYNIIQKFLNDSRFDVTLYCENNLRIKYLKTFPLFKDLKYAFPKFLLGNGGGNRSIENTKFVAEEYDIYINPEFHSQLFSEGRPVCFNIVHDIIPMLDNNWVGDDFKDYYREFYRKLDGRNYLSCISESCKRGFLRFFNKLDESKMFIAYNSTAQNFINKKVSVSEIQSVLKNYGIEFNNNKYIFYLGAANDERKNLIFNVECFIDFINKYNIKDLYFYIGGSGKDFLLDSLKNNLGVLFDKYSKYIVPLGFIKDEDVNILYSNSLFFSFLSLYEGFGMPPLEAMQAGTPVVCANNSSLPEVVGDAGILVDAEDEDEIIEAFRVMYFDENKRNEYIQKGIERAKLFNWDNSYKIISDKIIEVLMGKIV